MYPLSNLKMKKKYTDTEIIEAIRTGKSNNVLHYLYININPKIKAWIKQNNGSDDEAQDIFQDSVIAFYKFVSDNKFEYGKSVEGFLFTVAKNKWINRAKKMNQQTTYEAKHESNHYVANEYIDFKIKTEQEEKINKVLSQLGERCKELLTYSIFNKLSMEEISQKMGFSNADTAKTKNYKCKQRLIQLMNSHQEVKEFLYND